MRASLPIRFTTFGVAVGFPVASSLMPDGCAIHQAESLRLRIGVPVWFPLVLCGLGWLLRQERRRVVLVALTLVAIALLTAGVSLLYRGSLEDMGGALMVLGPTLAVVLVALPWAARPTRRLAGPILAAAAGASAALVFGLDTGPLDLRLALAGLGGCVALAIVAGHDVSALRRVGLAVEQDDDRYVPMRRARRAGVALVAVALAATGLAVALAVLPERSPPRSPGGSPAIFLGGC